MYIYNTKGVTYLIFTVFVSMFVTKKWIQRERQNVKRSRRVCNIPLNAVYNWYNMYIIYHIIYIIISNFAYLCHIVFQTNIDTDTDFT